eukprot:5567990-Amphidinium_carterae.4
MTFQNTLLTSWIHIWQAWNAREGEKSTAAPVEFKAACAGLLLAQTLRGLTSPGGCQWLGLGKPRTLGPGSALVCNPGGWSRAEGLITFGHDS